jgi:hypothetical protein
MAEQLESDPDCFSIGLTTPNGERTECARQRSDWPAKELLLSHEPDGAWQHADKNEGVNIADMVADYQDWTRVWHSGCPNDSVASEQRQK